MPEQMTVNVPVTFSLTVCPEGAGGPAGAKWSVFIPCNLPNPSAYSLSQHLGILSGPQSGNGERTIGNNFYPLANAYSKYQVMSAKMECRATPLHIPTSSPIYASRATDTYIFNTLDDRPFSYAMKATTEGAAAQPTGTGANQLAWLDAVPEVALMLTARNTNSKITHMPRGDGSSMRAAIVHGTYTPERVFEQDELTLANLVAATPVGPASSIPAPVIVASWTITGMGRGDIPSGTGANQETLLVESSAHPHRLDITINQMIKFSGFRAPPQDNLMPSVPDMEL
jgi:hypothetical protein